MYRYVFLVSSRKPKPRQPYAIIERGPENLFVKLNTKASNLPACLLQQFCNSLRLREEDRNVCIRIKIDAGPGNGWWMLAHPVLPGPACG